MNYSYCDYSIFDTNYGLCLCLQIST